MKSLFALAALIALAMPASAQMGGTAAAGYKREPGMTA